MKESLLYLTKVSLLSGPHKSLALAHIDSQKIRTFESPLVSYPCSLK